MRILSFVSFILSTVAIPTKICKNCKHFMPNKNFFPFFSSLPTKYAKCAKFPSIDLSDDERINKLVGCNDNPDREYRYCSIARKYDTYCGEIGKYFEEKK